MVLRDVSKEPFWLKIDGKWVHISTELLSLHPGGSAITTYKNRDATAVFHAFHTGSKQAYKMLADLRKEQGEQMPQLEEAKLEKLLPGFDDVNMGEYNFTEESEKKMIADFERLRSRVRQDGLLESNHYFYYGKVLQCVGMIAFAVLLQYYQWYITSALILGLAWQQLGWMIHEYCHHQHFKNRFFNDCMSYVTGNLLQGFSSGGWKEQHNIHHAATNVIGRDGDIDLMPLWATVPSDLKHMDDSSWTSYMLPYQHIYWTAFLPGLRLSWLIQSISFVSNMPTHFYKCYRDRATVEQITLGIHWFFVLLQLYCLPDLQTRVIYFLISQLFAGFLLAHVVTYNHYSTEKFHHNAKILDNYPCLQVYTTRNMRPGLFIDWLWGGLNYQIEHHLFPTMPRHNLGKAMPLVKAFCEEHKLPYLVDDYFTGWKLGVAQFENIARLAAKLKQKIV